MVENQNRLNELNECIRNHVDCATTWFSSCELRVSKEFGCGVFATRDIEPNEFLFIDRPLMLGPSANKSDPIVCVMCYEKIENDFDSRLCPNRCGFILCGSAECSNHHKTECQLLQSWKPKNADQFSWTKMKALLVIRALLIPETDKKFLDLMQKNYISVENDIFFDGEFADFPQDAKTFADLRAASAAINTNAFKVLYHTNDATSDVSIRGFYPIVSLINHNCVPNIRRDTDSKFMSRVSASQHIKKDEQIFTSYSQLLWGTNTRRMHMMVSKQFLCTCERCTDPTENSTNLAAIRCTDRSCTGLILPIEPINLTSNAKCNSCGVVCESKRFLQTQEMAGIIMHVFMKKKFTLDELNDFIEKRLYKVLPECSQFVVECKLKTIWKYNATNEKGFILFLFKFNTYSDVIFHSDSLFV